MVEEITEAEPSTDSEEEKDVNEQSSSSESETEETLLSVLQDAMEKPSEEAGSQPEEEVKEESEEEVLEADAESTDEQSDSTEDEDSYEEVPFNKHPRFQELVKEKNEYKVDAERYQNITIQRDLISPQIFVIGIHNGVASKSRLLVLNGSDNSEITTFNVTISNGTNTANICTDTCGVLIDDELSFQHGDLGYLTISLETSSGEVIFLNQSFVVDHAMNPPILSIGDSFNLSGGKIGPNSRIGFTTDEISKAAGGFGIPGFKWPL